MENIERAACSSANAAAFMTKLCFLADLLWQQLALAVIHGIKVSGLEK